MASGASRQTQKTLQRVLVVDDDLPVLASLRRLLSSRYEVATACGGERALVSFEGFAPDLVIADALMPGMDGLEVIRNVRQRRPTCRCLLLSGAPDAPLAERFGLNAGVILAKKPWKNEELLVLVATLLAAPVWLN